MDNVSRRLLPVLLHLFFVNFSILGSDSATYRVNHFNNTQDSLSAADCGRSYPSDGNRSGQYFLGFTNNESNAFFLSIWTTNCSIVWTANRKKPIGSDAVLEFVKGSLTLQSDGTEVWSTNTRGQAAYMDTATGNLRVVNADNQTLWQTFQLPAVEHLSLNLVLILGLCVIGLFCAAMFSVIGINVYKMKHSMRKSADEAFFKALPGLPTRFTMRELQTITSGFCHKLGSGGFGTVYGGVLPDGTKVAVKRLKNAAKQGRKEFRAEVELIGRVDHKNLVKLRGFCAEGSDNLLVYEFMPNGSLDSWLFNEGPGLQSQKLLPWSVRLKIALGTARGLAYLHEGLRDRIIHLDVKPQNILLNENFVPKLADFGLAKLLDRDQDASVVEIPMRGTPGYLAPEWQLQNGVTEKLDVYSYGMVLLEVVTGCRNSDVRSVGSHRHYLPAWALGELEEGNALDIVDDRLGGNFDQEQALRLTHVALLCLHEEAVMRPTMGTVVQMLEGRSVIPEIDNLNVEFAEVRHNRYSRFLSSINSGSLASPDSDSVELTLLSNIVVYNSR
ncbi:hypothetical protein R1sor_019924 [Riccia sorocarpa]|uniref:Protein kinase domain-containing protein n=1 Tax=Riccia sorocarpa TaxID=122646 RepID=A0ABD3IGM6_9MARC